MLCIFFKHITLVPLLDFISLMQLLWVFVSVECWTYKWYFALSLLDCMSECSFLVWMSIVVTIYTDYLFLVKPCFIALIYFAWLHCACFICFQGFYLQWSYYVVIFKKFLSYGSRASQILEVGVNKFCSTIPNSHVESRVCFRVLSRNNQRGRL